VLGAAVALWCSGSTGAPSALPLAAWALVAAVPPAVGVVAVVVAAAAPAAEAEAAVGAVAAATPRNGHMQYLGHRDIHTLQEEVAALPATTAGSGGLGLEGKGRVVAHHSGPIRPPGV
jgi:hypothetical protein